MNYVQQKRELTINRNKKEKKIINKIIANKGQKKTDKTFGLFTLKVFIKELKFAERVLKSIVLKLNTVYLEKKLRRMII